MPVVERERELEDIVAALGIAQEGLAASRGPLDRTSRAAGGPSQEGEVRVEKVARTEPAADILGYDPNLFGRDAEHPHQTVL